MAAGTGSGGIIMNGRRWRLLMVVAIVVAVLLIVRELQPESGGWVRVERRDLVIGVDVEGTLRSLAGAEIGPPNLSRVSEYRLAWIIPEGSQVAEGDPIMRFDVTQLRQQLQAKLNERASAEKSLEKEVTNLEIEQRQREKELSEARGRHRVASLKVSVPETLVTPHELEKARIDLDLAEMEIAYLGESLEHFERESKARLRALRENRDRAAARVKDLETTLAAMTVRAPRSGTVIYVSGRRGEKYKVGDRVWQSGKVMEIPDLNQMQAEGQIAEADAGRIAVGQPVTLYLDAYPDQQYRGKVSSIRRAVQRKYRSAQKIVKLEIELDETDREKMRPGMRLRGTIEVERIADALVVPQDAVFSRPGGAVVFTRTLFGRSEVAPVFGQRNAEVFEIVSGLDEGDRVLRRSSDQGASG
jgi:multidrug efflux pump subunit AcrA (membrane-fusion protein)